jgi:hypothetical protein
MNAGHTGNARFFVFICVFQGKICGLFLARNFIKITYLFSDFDLIFEPKNGLFYAKEQVFRRKRSQVAFFPSLFTFFASSFFIVVAAPELA